MVVIFFFFSGGIEMLVFFLANKGMWPKLAFSIHSNVGPDIWMIGFLKSV